MKKILVFSFFPAFVPSSNGGESRLFNFYKSLSQFYHVTLLSSSYSNVAEEKIFHGSNFVERRIAKDINFAEKWDELTAYASGGDLSAVCIAASGKNSTLLHAAYLEEYAAADMIFHDSPFTIDYDLFFGIDEKIRVYNSYNCETVLYKALHPEAKSKPLWDLVEAAEVKILSACDGVLYCNKNDLQAFKQLAPKANYSAIAAPNGMTPLVNIARVVQQKAIQSIVFLGSGHPPNVEAALKIVELIAPALPAITFHIIGRCLAEGKYAKNIIRHGFVDDATKVELLSNADLAINPMGMGSGSNVKVFDLFSYGIPVLSSEFGMRGIDAKHKENCLIAPLEEFSKTIEFWSGHYDELQKIGENGRQFANKYYSWDVIAANVAKQLLKQVKTPHWAEKFILVLNDYDSFNNTGGGSVRTREIYATVNQWCPVVFICFSDDDEINIRYENDQTLVFSLPKTQAHKQAEQEMSAYFHVSANDIIAHRYCRSNVLLVNIYNALKALCRHIVIEHPYMASIPLSYNDRFIYSSQNHETQIKKDLLTYHPLYAELISDIESIERQAVECSLAVIAVSEQDAAAFVKGARTSGPVLVVHNGASVALTAEKQELAGVRGAISKTQSAVFVGSAHMPNIDAVKYIVETLAPACPEIDFHIVGTVCHSFTGGDSDNLSLWGVLSESMKSAVMQSCRVALNTVTTGGGSNIKLADYFANGLFVVTTPFGLRGYPAAIQQHSIVSELKDFETATKQAMLAIQKETKAAIATRKKFFTDYLSMESKAQGVVSLLKNLEKPKKKVLFVTYRYTYPILGGAESMFENLVAAMDKSNDFQIDIIAPEVSKINNQYRFSEGYEFDPEVGAKTGLNNVRFARFPLTAASSDVNKQVATTWQVQTLFEKELYQQLKNDYKASGLAWGWGDPEGDINPVRWGFISCGLHLHKQTKVQLSAYAYAEMVVWVKNQQGQLLCMQQVKGKFSLEFTAAGAVEITTSTVKVGEDMRPLAFHLSELLLNEEALDLASPLVSTACQIDDKKRFRVLDKARLSTRDPLGLSLTDMRGPFSAGLDSYLADNIEQYDLVVTHNNIFRPAVSAVKQAKKSGVPIISIPHAHLDDDFYHFSDVHESVVNSDLVLAAPKIACEFYAQRGANVDYLAAGVDTQEKFTQSDISEFKKEWAIDSPFILVLGRKSNAKGYQKVIDAVENLSKKMKIHLVMIGPDDDNIMLDSAQVSYLGRQSRAVVRGALLSCEALVNMSTSESFGIVLLEAWMAGKPVIVNKSCAAFHDLAIDKHNALMVDNSVELQTAISSLIKDPELAKRLAKNGQEILQDYDWNHIGDIFLGSCHALIKERATLGTCTKQVPDF